MSEELGRQLLPGSALFALLLGMFAITVGHGIVLPILRATPARPRSCRAPALVVNEQLGERTGCRHLAHFLLASFMPQAGRLWRALHRKGKRH